MNAFKIQSNFVDITAKRIYPAEISIANNIIESVIEVDGEYCDYIMPGFIDSHIHIESSMLAPSEFARAAVKFGTIATVSDPHEIANVLGAQGVQYMINSGKKTPFKFFFGAPSCVPATNFESSGATLDSSEIEALLSNDEILYLSEMMNFPGVIFDDSEVNKKLESAKSHGKPIDGHAPGLSGADLAKYEQSGISTDHECSSFEEAKEKIALGMKILIREGSAAKDFDALHKLIDEHTDAVMLCSDDKHPDELMNGHINLLVKRALANGIELFKVLQCACLNPISHFSLPVGALKTGDHADFIIVNNLQDFDVKATYINGEKVAENGIALFPRAEIELINNFNANPKNIDEFKIPATSEKIRIIETFDGSLYTKEKIDSANIINGMAESDVKRDILKIAVVNRYNNAKPALAFVKNIGLKSGAIATSVAHDSHNIIAVGANDEALCGAINEIIKTKGGMCVANGSEILSLPLPIAGLMSDKSLEETAELYAELDLAAKKLGSPLSAPFMTLSFLALLVIPELKLSDKGLFDGKTFSFTNLFV